MQTALGCSGSAFTTIILLMMGLIYASMQMKGSGEKVCGLLIFISYVSVAVCISTVECGSQFCPLFSSPQMSSKIVPMPMIGMSNTQGPWPKCVGMIGDDCVSYIESNAQNLNIVIVHTDDLLSRDFDLERVRVQVDNDEVVNSIPRRG